MNKTSIKNYAIWARNELISRVSQKAYEYGVEKDIFPMMHKALMGDYYPMMKRRKGRY